MSHEVETMAYAGDVPWHGLGVKVPSDLTAHQMLKKAGLDWRVVKEKQHVLRNGVWIPSGYDILSRETDGQILTQISEGWEETQNEEAAEWLETFIAKSGGSAKMHTAGSLRAGKQVWFLVEIDKEFVVLKKDRVKSFLLFSNPHMYGRSRDIRFTPVRVVCHNTITMALNGKSDVVIKQNHRTKFDPTIVDEALGLADERFKEYQSMAKFLAGKKYTPANVINYFKAVFPLPENSTKLAADPKNAISKPAAEAFAALDKQPGAELARGTWWNAFNAVTYSVDHTLGRDNETRMFSAWYGHNRLKKIAALKTAMEHAEAA